MKKQFLILFAFISTLALSQVPQRFNRVIVTGDITSPKFIKTGSTVDSVLLGNGGARAISTIKTDTVNLSNRINAKATGSGTANGTNTGDETLTSIKTKLGAASAVSDGYLKYQDFALLHTPTTVAAANGLSISGQNISLQNASLTQSGALTFNDWNTFNSKEPAIIKNSGFNLPLGTTTGTVLEGRTFGTAANSAVGDFIQNQNTSAQSANMWINGKIESSALNLSNSSNTANIGGFYQSSNYLIARSGTSGFLINNSANDINYLSIESAGQATFSSTVNSTGFLLNGNNLTSSLSTNYLPKWNGSNFVNSLIYSTAGAVGIGTSNINSNFNTVGDIFFGDGSNLYGVTVHPTLSGQFIHSDYYGGSDSKLTLGTYANRTNQLILNTNGTINIGSTTPSTLPTNGALVVGGGIGADHVRANYFSGNGSNLTGVQLPITLTTNGTSGAATFSGNVLNVPNYDVGGVNQTQTTVSGSTSGNMVCSMPFRTGSYKKVIIYINNLNGSASYTYPTQFTTANNQILYGSGYSISGGILHAVTVTALSPTTGWLIIEGY